jgi:hypothetical protein
MNAERTSLRPRSDPARLLLSRPPDSRVAAYLLGAAMLVIWTWWALAQGAFFGRVLLPGGILLYAVLALTAGSVRLPISSRGPHAVALLAFLGLAAWTALSMLWTPARDLALDYAQRDFLYAFAFAAGVALTAALRQRMSFSLVPFFGAGAIVVTVLVVKVLTATDVERLVDIDGTLDFPFGYRNANAGFFTMLAFGSMPLIARAKSPLQLRIGAAGLAAASLALVAISQSRGSVLGALAGIVVLLLCSTRRGWALMALGIVILPVALLFPFLLDPYEAAGTSAALGELQSGVVASLVAGLIAAALAAAAISLERRGAGIALPRPSRRQAAAASVGGLVAAIAIFTALVGNPVSEIDAQISKVSSSDPSYGEVSGSRFTYGGGLNRLDFWDVAIGQAAGSPLTGEGAGSFRPTYLVEGDGSEAPRNAHSLPLEVLGELGVVGLLLLCAGFAAATVAALRSRRLGPEAALLSSVALVVAAVALAQAAVDWSWYFGGQIAPVFALLGAAAAPSALAFEPLSRRVRRGVVVAAGVLSLVALPTFISERLTLDAAEGWRTDAEGAYGALATAADLNPLADAPLLVEAQIARESGDAPRALVALEEAERREPDDWQSYYLGAKTLQREDPEAALVELEKAEALNPTAEDIAALRKTLERRTEGDGS